MNIGNNKNMSFNKPSGNIDKTIIEEIDKKVDSTIQEFTEIVDDLEKIEISDEEPTDENVVIWVNTAQDAVADIMLRINDETIASNTVWSSEKVNSQIQDIIAEASAHTHDNKEAIDKITVRDIDKWNNKSEFSGSYNDLTNKPMIPSINGLASEEYVDEAIENLQLPSNLATKEDIPTKVSDLENDEGYITDIPSEYITEEELGSKGYLTQQHLVDYPTKHEIPTKVSQLENDSNFIKSVDLHGHNNKDVIDSITSEKIAQWENHFSGDYNDLKNRPKNLITQGELESKGYITEADIEGLDKVISSDVEPTNNNIILWINTSQSQSTEIVARIKDNLVNKETTWSSEKIFEEYNKLLTKYNELLRRIIILEGGNPDDTPSNPDNPPIIEEYYLQDIEGYYLQDIEGYYLIPLEGDDNDNNDGSENPPSTPPIVEENYLQDIEGYYLQDLEGYYLIPLESDGSSNPIIPPGDSITDYYYLQDKERKYLQDKNGNYLVVKIDRKE